MEKKLCRFWNHPHTIILPPFLLQSFEMLDNGHMMTRKKGGAEGERITEINNNNRRREKKKERRKRENLGEDCKSVCWRACFSIKCRVLSSRRTDSRAKKKSKDRRLTADRYLEGKSGEGRDKGGFIIPKTRIPVDGAIINRRLCGQRFLFARRGRSKLARLLSCTLRVN